MSWKRRMASASILALLLGMLGVAPAAVAAGGLLDGKSFAGETGEKGKATGDKEEFVFKDGKFDPLGCHPWGFSAAPYRARDEGGAVRFESETVSEKEGTMAWKGTARGDRLEGTMVWTKAGQAPAEYWFKASLRR